METNVKSPQAIFALPQQMIVPIYQRHYVWEEEHQWEPLWQDILRVCELRLSGQATITHFLGAVVIQSQQTSVGALQQHEVIDGQQRLTTLQLLMDAATAALDEADEERLARRLESLTHNAEHFVQPGESPLKLRHSNSDRDSFDAVMTAPVPIDYDSLPGHRPKAAHKFFADRVRGWLGDPEESQFKDRAETLVAVLESGLQLVVIGLEVHENSQAIFETLNARGTPLTSADLIKNFIFQRLAAEGADTAAAYANEWPFDTSWWEQEVAVGRHNVSRSSLFFGQWLVARTGIEYSPSLTFNRFKKYVEHDQVDSMTELLSQIRASATQYREWELRSQDPVADLDPVTMCLYRMRCMDTEVLRPVLIWLAERQASSATIGAVVAAAESYLVRRSMLRLAIGNVRKVMADLITQTSRLGDHELGAGVRSYLSSLDSESNYWPGDAEIRRELAEMPAYNRYSRARLRMLLEAAEDHLRGYSSRNPKSENRVPRKGYPIEHLLPQKWINHWPVEGLAAEIDRREHVHRLGNLTLITAPLNSSVSDGPWLGSEGKSAKLKKHSVLLMNQQVRELGDEGWDESTIDRRTDHLIDALLETWKVPAGHQGVVADRNARPAAWVTLGDLIVAGLISPGDKLRGRGPHSGQQAVVVAGGDVEFDGKTYDSPSGAGYQARGRKATNGWYFWYLEDDRRLKDVRAEYLRTVKGENARQEQVRGFWETAIPVIRERHSDWVSWDASTKSDFRTLYYPVRGVTLAAVWKLTGLTNQIYFEDSPNDEAINLARYRRLEAHKAALESAVGAKLEWDPMPGSKAARVVMVSPYRSLDDESAWPEMVEWIIDGQERLRMVLAQIGPITVD